MVKNVGGPQHFEQGEYDFTFGKADLTVTHPNSTKSTYDVATTQGDTFSLTNHADKSVIHVTNSLVENLKYTTAMGLSTEFSNSTYPISFDDSIKHNDTLTFTLFQCNRWAASGTCDFTPSAP